MAESVDFELQAGATSVEPIGSFTPEPPEPPAAPDSVPAPLRRWLRQAADYARLMRLDRPIGIWLLLWPTLWALWTASFGHPHTRLLAIFVAGSVLMRSAGCVINDLLDRDIDPHVRRTRDRPLAARRIAPLQALVLFVVRMLLGMDWQSNWLDELLRAGGNAVIGLGLFPLLDRTRAWESFAVVVVMESAMNPALG